MGAPPISLRAAAKLLGTTQPALTRAMRDAGHLLADNVPCAELMKSGLFVVESRCFVLENGKRKPYQVTLVTIQGLAWLDDRINANTLRKVS